MSNWIDTPFKNIGVGLIVKVHDRSRDGEEVFRGTVTHRGETLFDVTNDDDHTRTFHKTDMHGRYDVKRYVDTPTENRGRSTGPYLHFEAGKAVVGGPLYPESSEKAVYGATTGITETSAVNHPLHYNQDPSGVECIQIIRHRNYNIGAAIKYLWRHGLKDADAEIEDLEKAVWHIRDEIDRLEGHV